MKKKVLFLDFDGVLFDTLREVYLVNRFFYLGKDFLEEINNQKYELFSKYKFLVYNIWMFYYYNPLIFDEIPENNIEEAFSNSLLNRNKKNEEEFCIQFLKIRNDLAKNHYDFWKNLEKPYEFFFGIKKLFEEKNIEIAIVSKKNKTSILERFKSYGFNFSENRVFAREILDKYSSKGEFLDEFMLQNGFESAIFVDDNENNLKTAKNNSKIKNILALWGNTQPCAEGFTQEEALEEIEMFFK